MRRRTIKLFGVLSVLLATQTGCKDFFESSVANSKLILVAPGNGTETNKYQVGFWWEPVADALSYRLQIATPDFTKPVSLVSDTLIRTNNRLELTLDPGKYEWRVRAENGSSVSAYQTAAFTVHPSSLEEQKVTLMSPGNGYLSNRSAVQLSWNALFGAIQYRLQIDTLNFADEDKLVYNQAQNDSQFSFNFPKDQVYRWRVRGESGTENSKWSESRTMTYDKTPPAKPEIIAPANGAVLTQPVLLSWKAVSTAKKYKLYLYKSDGTSPYNSSFPLTLTATSYSFELSQLQGEVVFWKVMAIDEIGNEGPLTDARNFSIQ